MDICRAEAICKYIKDETQIDWQYMTDDSIVLQMNNISITLDYEENFCRIHHHWTLLKGFDFENLHDTKACANLILNYLNTV